MTKRLKPELISVCKSIVWNKKNPVAGNDSFKDPLGRAPAYDCCLI